MTGATSGIGLATTLGLARAGFHVIGSARTAAKAARLAECAASHGLDIETVVIELGESDVETRPIAELGLWGLVNNAGYMNVGTIEDVDAAAARQQFETMVFAPIRLCQAVLPGMRAAGEGRIVLISSAQHDVTGPMLGWYQATKHALSALADALRVEVADFGIDVVQVEPGGHRTGIWSRAAREIRERRIESPYEQLYDAGLSVLESLRSAMPSPDRVGDVVVEAMTAGRPCDRYRVGADTVALDRCRAVAPSGIKDRLTRSVLRRSRS